MTNADASGPDPEPAVGAPIAADADVVPNLRRSRRPLWIVAGLAGVSAVAFVIYLVVRPGPASRTFARPRPTAVAGAFETGGVPLGDPAIEKLLVGPFTDYILTVDLDRRTFGKHTADRTAAAAAIVNAPAMAKSPALASAWRELVSLFDRWISLPISSPEFDAMAKEVRARARAVSDQLAAAGLGYYVEGDVFGGGDAAHAVVYSYHVEEVVFLKANGARRRVLSLRRLDELSISHALLGMESQDLGDPIVLLDQVDHHVATYVLPAIAPDAPFPLADDKWDDPSKIAIAAGAAVRAELARALGADATAATQIATLLAERGKLVDSWRATVERRDMRLSKMRDLFLPPHLVDQLDGMVPKVELDRATQIDEEIATLEGPRIAARVHDLVVRTVRHHEAQHGLDADRASPLPYPERLAAHVGAFQTKKGEPRPAAEHANAELSAYTSQIANDLVTPHLSLWSLAHHAFSQNGWGTPESYVAVLVLEGIARELGTATPDPIIHDGRIDRARLAAIVATFGTRSGDELRTAARALYKDFYAEAYAAITE